MHLLNQKGTRIYRDMNQNIFVGNKFNRQMWQAFSTKSKKELENILSSMELEGRIVKDITFVGHAYNLSRMEIEETVYSGLENLGEEERQRKSDYDNIDKHFLLRRFAEIDEPLLISFQDGEQLELNADLSCYEISMNKIPFDIKPGICSRNAHAKVLLYPCLHHAITEIEVVRGQGIDDIAALIIWFKNDVGLRMETYLDYCHIKVLNRKQEYLHIEAGELKRSLFNWEDIHYDSKIEFGTNSPTIWVGERAREEIDIPFITILAENNDSMIYVQDTDTQILDIALSSVTGDFIDIYEDYDFSYEQWIEMLEIADKVTSFETLEALKEYLVTFRTEDNGYMAEYFDKFGNDFWENMKLHQYEVEDLKRWTNIVLEEGKHIYIGGY